MVLFSIWKRVEAIVEITLFPQRLICKQRVFAHNSLQNHLRFQISKFNHNNHKNQLKGQHNRPLTHLILNKSESYLPHHRLLHPLQKENTLKAALPPVKNHMKPSLTPRSLLHLTLQHQQQFYDRLFLKTHNSFNLLKNEAYQQQFQLQPCVLLKTIRISHSASSMRVSA